MSENSLEKYYARMKQRAMTMSTYTRRDLIERNLLNTVCILGASRALWTLAWLAHSRQLVREACRAGARARISGRGHLSGSKQTGFKFHFCWPRESATGTGASREIQSRLFMPHCIASRLKASTLRDDGLFYRTRPRSNPLFVTTLYALSRCFPDAPSTSAFFPLTHILCVSRATYGP